MITISLSSITHAQNRMTAKHLKSIADSMVVLVAGDAKLIMMRSCRMDSSFNCWNSDLDTSGMSSIWSFVYISIDSIKNYYYVAENNQVRFACARGPDSLLLDVGFIDALSFDSDSALAIAERNGGSNIVKKYPTCVIRAGLYGYFSPKFQGSIWRIEYKCTDSIRAIAINAVTGTLITSVEQTRETVLPISPTLQQNFPQPFNPSTTIQFTLPNESHVTLKVYNLLGQEVQTLVNDNRTAGIYSVDFNAGKMSSGVYFYTLRAGGFVETRKMLVVR